jgi:hypothetical protein
MVDINKQTQISTYTNIFELSFQNVDTHLDLYSSFIFIFAELNKDKIFHQYMSQPKIEPYGNLLLNITTMGILQILIAIIQFHNYSAM